MQKTSVILVLLLLICSAADAQVLRHGMSNKITISSPEYTGTDTVAMVLLNTKGGGVSMYFDWRNFVFANDSMSSGFHDLMETEKPGPTDHIGKLTHPNRLLTFTGDLSDSLDYSKDGTHNVTITGILTIHQVKVRRTFPAVVTVKAKQVTLDFQLEIILSEHQVVAPAQTSRAILINVHSIMLPVK